jgi:hypothetical protein
MWPPKLWATLDKSSAHRLSAKAFSHMSNNSNSPTAGAAGSAEGFRAGLKRGLGVAGVSLAESAQQVGNQENH